MIADDDSDDNFAQDERADFFQRQIQMNKEVKEQNQILIKQRNFTQDRFNYVVKEELVKKKALKDYQQEETCDIDRAVKLY